VRNLSFRHFPQNSLAILVAVCACLVPLSGIRAADTDNAPSFTNDKTGEVLSSLPALFDAKKYDEALKILDNLMPGLDPSSYDMMVVYDTRGRVFFQGKDQPAKSIEDWEKMWALIKQHPEYMVGKDLVDHYEFMAQAYFFAAVALKTGDPQQRELFDHAVTYAKRWLAATPKPGSQERFFVTELFYYKAVNSGSDKPDMDSLMETKHQAEEALVSDIRPREEYYQILTQIAQQQEDYATAAKYVEWLVKTHPTNKEYWGQLYGCYNNLAVTSEKDPRQRRVYYALAINTLERAQALGYLNSPRDNYTVVSLYNDVGQYAKAAELLGSGLRSGKINDVLDNWRALSDFYRKMNQDLQAINVLKEAEAMDKYSGLGDLDIDIADLYNGLDDTGNAYVYSKKAAEKGNLQKMKPYVPWENYAYLAYELGKFEEALQAIEKALEYPNAPKECANLKDGIMKAIKLREIEKAALKAQIK
jgi:tetratricopeptide (TPR) repeat protein